MFSVKEILKKSPAEIATGVVTLVDLAAILDIIDVSKDQIAALNIALVTVLTLFYVKSNTTNTAKLDELKVAQDDAFMFGATVAAPVVGHAETVTVQDNAVTEGVVRTATVPAGESEGSPPDWVPQELIDHAKEGGQASLPVILVILAVICALIGLWTAAKFLIIVAAVIVVVALVVGSRSRV